MINLKQKVAKGALWTLAEKVSWHAVGCCPYGAGETFVSWLLEISLSI